MKNIFQVLILVVSVLASGISSASACLAGYGNLQAPGVYFGTGNVNGEFRYCADYNIGVQVALRLKNRQTLMVIPDSSGAGHYVVDAGTFAGGNDKAKWNYEFSASEFLSEISHTMPTGISYRFGVDHNPGAVVDYSWVDPKTFWGDNALAPAGYVGFQNSENISFLNTPGGPLDVSQNGLYTFAFQAWQNNIMVASTDFDVRVVGGHEPVDPPVGVPEPGTTSMMLAGLALVGFTSRRRSKKQTK